MTMVDGGPAPKQQSRAHRAGFRRPTTGTALRWIVLAGAAVYFVGPMIAAIAFTVRKPGGGVTLKAYQEIFEQPDSSHVSFVHALTFSLLLSIATIVVTMALMVPTQILLHLRLQKMRPLVETICLLPLVFPPVVLVVGVSDIYRAAQPAGESGGGAAFQVLKWMRDSSHPLLLVVLYVVMALPFVYRALNAGLASIEVSTLVEASRNLGASWWTTIVVIIIPSLRSSMVNAGFLCFALTMGEFTVASILLYDEPFPVWLAQLPTTSGQVQAAVSVFSLLLVEVTLLVVSGIGLTREPRNAEQKGKS